MLKQALRTLAHSAYAKAPYKRQFFEALKNRVEVPHRLYRHLVFSDVFQVDVNDTSSFRIRHYGYEVENELFWRGFTGRWEATTLTLWARAAARSLHTIDIGANTGVFALSAKALSPRARVVAFEPAERIFNKLQANIELNQFAIEAVQKGVSSSTKRMQFFDTTAEHTYAASLNPDQLGDRPDLTSTEVEVVSLDEFLSSSPTLKVDLIKIDVEMHEDEVLAGAQDCLARDTPTVLIELLTQDLARKADEAIDALGYMRFQVLEDRGLKSLARLEDGSFNDGTSNWNFLLCPESQKHLVKDLVL